jgi:dCMP deaminase
MEYKTEKNNSSLIPLSANGQIWAENSYCIRRKVGALIVKDRMIISDGYNGTPSGFENNCEDEDNKTKPYVLHAEPMPLQKSLNRTTAARMQL